MDAPGAPTVDLQAILQAAARPGTTGGELYELALEWATAHGYGESFMGAAEPRIRFVPGAGVARLVQLGGEGTADQAAAFGQRADAASGQQ